MRQFTVAKLAAALQAKGWKLATAESLTGGAIAVACTELAGASAWFDGGFVTYSPEAKAQSLGVPAALIAQHGVVSEEVACAMAQGVLAHSRAQVAVAVTGIAGPTGGSATQPVGTVCVAWALPHLMQSSTQHFAGDRASVREQTVAYALEGLASLLGAA